jgi:membrane protein
MTRSVRAAEPRGTGWKAVLLQVRSQVRDDNVSLLSAGVAFYAMLSLFPGLIALISIYGLVAEPRTARAQVQKLADVMPRQARQTLTGQLEALTQSAGRGLSLGAVLGILAALLAASAGMRAMIAGLNVAYDCVETRRFVRLRTLALLLTLGAILTMAVAIGIVVVLPVVTDALGPVGRVVLAVVRWPVLAGLMLLGLAMLYRHAPDRDGARFRWLSWGSLLATALWLAGSALFSLYVNSFATYNRTYGVLGAVIVLLIWLFLTSFVVLLGAELNRELELGAKQAGTAAAPAHSAQGGDGRAAGVPVPPQSGQRR